MKILFGIFFLIFPIITQAQWQDNFDDGDIRSSPPWMGDTMDFRVNSSDAIAVECWCSRQPHFFLRRVHQICSPNWNGSFFIRQNFSPSSGNYGRVYLVSDQQILGGLSMAIICSLANLSSNDAVELFRQDGTKPGLCLSCNRCRHCHRIFHFGESDKI